MKHRGSYSPEVRERAIRMVREQRDQYRSEWATILSIAKKLGCRAETLRLWIRQAERDAGQQSGATTEMSEELKRSKQDHREAKAAGDNAGHAREPTCWGVLSMSPQTSRGSRRSDEK